MTSRTTDDAAVQLADELHGVAWRLHCVGLAFADPNERVAGRQLAQVSRVCVAQLRQEDDDRLAAQTVIDLMGALWPRAAPEDVDEAEWWQTPLGRLCARSLGRDDTEAVSHSVAAAMLGVTRGSVAQMVHRGTLDRHPDGGVLRASVLQRLGR